MKPEVKKKYIKALKYNRYTRGGDYLHTADGNKKHFTALGVLTDLWLKDYNEKTNSKLTWSLMPLCSYGSLEDEYEWDTVPRFGLSSTKHVDVQNEVMGRLSTRVMKWAGLENPWGEIDGYQGKIKKNTKLYEDLDSSFFTIKGLQSLDYTFHELAKVLEKTV